MLVRDEFALIPREEEVGIEIEMEGKNLPRDVGSRWRVEHDGSLRGLDAVEYVFKSPASREEYPRRVKQLYRTFKTAAKEGGVIDPNPRCGVHVHINVQELDFDQVLKFVVLYLIVEEPLIKWCGEHREGNLFCLRAKDAEDLIWALVQCSQAGSFRLMQHNEYRYASLNLTSLSKYGSLEFRGMRATDTPEPIIKWASVLLSLKDISQQFDSAANIVSTFSADGVRFITDVVMKDHKDCVDFPGLGEMLWDGVRLVQDIVYTNRALKKNFKRAHDMKVAEWLRLENQIEEQPIVAGVNNNVELVEDFDFEDENN